MNNIKLYGYKWWYLEDDIQRPYTDNLECINGQFCIKGKLCHREDGPAIEYSYGRKDYLQYGKLHRIGGPAVEWIDGGKEYFENGKRHREDGPAVEWSNGRIEYWLNGRQISESDKEFEQFEIYQMFK